MKIKEVSIRDFSAFGKTEFKFCPGVNVLIGANATGKTHLLKALYAASFVSPRRGKPLPTNEKFADQLSSKLISVFKPDEDKIEHLIRQGCQAAEVKVQWDLARVAFKIASGDLVILEKPFFKDEVRSVFIPSREVLSMFRGFIAAYDERELSIYETYYDISKALTLNVLKKRRPDRLKLVRQLHDHLGGEVFFSGKDFYVKSPKEIGGKGTEAQLLSEGMRKVAMLAHLINNGAIRRQGILFWDEPESSLNPKMIPLMAEILLGIAAMDVQVFIATHDYLLTRELSLASEYKIKSKSKVRFFCFSRENLTSPVKIESGEILSDLRHNPILEEFADHYDREQKLFIGDIREAKGVNDVR